MMGTDPCIKCGWCGRLPEPGRIPCTALGEDGMRQVYLIGDDEICKREIRREIGIRMAELPYVPAS